MYPLEINDSHFAYNTLKNPFKAELYNIEQIKILGKGIAKAHVLVEGKVKTTLLRELKKNAETLEQVHELLRKAIGEQKVVSPASVWILDNYYILIEQIQSLKQDLTEQYLRQLPQIANGQFKGIPRIYEIILELLAHTDSKIDRLNIESIISGYQEHSYLTLGELWAIPLLLRLAFIENITRIALKVAQSRIELDKANDWIDQIKAVASQEPRKIILNLARLAESGVTLNSAFVYEANRQLKSLGLDIVSSWLEFYLSGQSTTVEEQVSIENGNQAENRISIANCMNSLRLITNMNWREFIEQLSKIDFLFRAQSNDAYPKSDFATRDNYRHEIEKFARDHKLPEIKVAEEAVRLSETAFEKYGAQDRRSQIGYYLIDDGLKDLHIAFQARATFPEIISTGLRRHLLLFYISSFVLMAGLATFYLLNFAIPTFTTPWIAIPFAIVLSFCVLYTCVELTNYFSTQIANPKLIPRMDYKADIPAEARTLVVIAMLLFNEQEISQQIKQLETIFLSNPGKNLHFGLMTDWVDSDQEVDARDVALFEHAASEITALNQKYKSTGGNVFCLFHRKRTFNELEKKWMGWERKRGGILNLFSALLDKNQFSRYYGVVGDHSGIHKFKYAVLLDVDTFLPFNAAKKLIAAIDHPLNFPEFDPTKQRVVKGYAILQPSVLVNYTDLNKSKYIQLFGGETGIDPYSTLTSNVYQDLFKEGSFIGKGIYNIQCFMKAVEHRFPENLLLSHDLIESTFTRSGIVSDMRIFEDAPSNYLNDAMRVHRWIRGDWQIYEWLGKNVRDDQNRLQRNAMSGLSKWKIFDNLRRSLVPFAFLVLFYFGWFFTSEPLFWIIFPLILLILPQIIATTKAIFSYPKNVSFSLYLRRMGERFKTILGTFTIKVLVLPFEAYFYLDAIVRSLWRMKVSHRRLLEWKTFRETRMTNLVQIGTFYKRMVFAPFLASTTLIALLLFDPSLCLQIGGLLILWILSPLFMYKFSKPFSERKTALSNRDRSFLRSIARKTWGFFETFVGPDTNWLPPDNYQENPTPVVARRTSPTNIGLSLLTNLSAYEFGFISAGTYLGRLKNAFATLDKLARYRGHFYNWYDLDRLQPLNPPYISTVDSGNLIGCLLTLREGLPRIFQDRLDPCRMFIGLDDALAILRECLENASHEQKKSQESRLSILGKKVSEAQALLSQISATEQVTSQVLNKLEGILASINELREPGLGPEINYWIIALQHSSTEIQLEFDALLSWMEPAQKILSILPKVTKDDLRATNQDQDLNPQVLSVVTQLRGLCGNLTLTKILQRHHEILESLQAFTREAERKSELLTDPALPSLLEEFSLTYSKTCSVISTYMQTVEALSFQCMDFSTAEYQFLVNRDSNLFSIGFRVDQHILDNGSYDLLASEARLTSFIAVAFGILDTDHWFALSRQLTVERGKITLVSWGGTMFEYLLPILLMPSYQNTLLDQTYKNVVDFQIQYGLKRKVPWGVSESGYNLTDAAGNYQYQAFGVPELGIKRGLEHDLVVTPYATALALMVTPDKAIDNLRKLNTLGMGGKYGFYEALDYTPSRVPPNSDFAIIQSFMAHHQGMILLALGNVLLERSLHDLFEGEPHFNSALLLLQERVPAYIQRMQPRQVLETQVEVKKEGPVTRIIEDVVTPIPETHLLSNGEYHVMLTSAGSGYSQCQGLAITRWYEDLCQDHWGFACYVKDLKDNKVGSLGYQPVLEKSERYSAIFSSSSAEFFNTIGELSTHVVITVAPEDNLELRRLRITNNSNLARTVQLFSYVEVAFSTAEQDIVHPAFNKLFVETEIRPAQHLVIAKRRGRSNQEKNPIIFHFMKVHGVEPLNYAYETDRERFIGRGSTLQAPRGVMSKRGLSNTEGYVLDPVLSISPTLRLEPDEQVTVDLFLGVAPAIEEAVFIAENYQNRHISDRIFDIAWTQEQLFLRQLNITEIQAQIFQQLGGSLLYSNSLRRAETTTILRNQKAQDSLWALNVSGDLPIMLVFIENFEGLEFLKVIAKGFAYLLSKGLQFDLVVINKDFGGYRQELQDQIFAILESKVRERAQSKGRPYVFLWDQLSEDHKILLQAVSRVVLSSENGTLEEQVESYRIPDIYPRRLGPLLPILLKKSKPTQMPYLPLTEFNGYGGFTPDGKEYITFIRPGRPTPRPWSNVLANKQFGTVVTESGGSYTWDQNAHEYRLTPWYNDWVTDPSGEAFYLRDDGAFKAWSLMPLPRAGSNNYTCHHGLGYSHFEYSEDGIKTDVRVYVHLTSPVKYVLAKIHNHSGRPRALSLYGYVEWVLGDHRSNTCTHVATRQDLESGAILAVNPFNRDFSQKVAFFTTNRRERTITTDRLEFIGRNRTLREPIALERIRLSNRTGAGLDPCGAIHVPLRLNAGEEQQVLFVIGCGANEAQAKQLAQHHDSLDVAYQALEDVWEYWKRTLGVIFLETPDPQINILGNYWLLYQTLACRIWGRSSFYQSGGGFGFRDQLQDVMALVHAQPRAVRDHIIECATRQFIEGDVQHWWHPPQGRGVRTTFSDDYLWLPFVTAYYLRHTADGGILDEVVPFIEGRPLASDEESYYDLPAKSATSASLYEHCKRAILRGLKFGTHGLPLMGCGDWNDGMNLVGKGGGESVWLAFFLLANLTDFAQIAQQRGDASFAATCATESAKITANVETHAWDGQWYTRAFFADGTPLGSHSSLECQIDSIPQSWAVLSRGGTPDHARTALDAAYSHLARPDRRMFLLFTPPFNASPLDPGYVKGYPPGIRENGGQYTHAAIWVAMAFAQLGNSAKTWEILSYLNPIFHGNSPVTIETYKVEPYVVSADIYSSPAHEGQGGWTWYTGSAGWLYRLIIESVLGLDLAGHFLRFTPCLPPDWLEFKVHYRFGDTFYHLHYQQAGSQTHVSEVSVDGVIQPDLAVDLVNDRRDHAVDILLKEPQETKEPANNHAGIESAVKDEDGKSE